MKLFTKLLSCVVVLLALSAASKNQEEVIVHPERLILVTNIPQGAARTYGQHTKAINEAYCSRWIASRRIFLRQINLFPIRRDSLIKSVFAGMATDF